MKVSFIGAGRVGSAAAFSVVHTIDRVDEVVMLDIMNDLALGEAMDLQHAAFAMERKHVSVKGTSDYADTADSHIYVVTAGLARRQGQTREDLAKINYNIISSVAKGIKENASDGSIVITATNPMDVMNYAMFKATGFKRNRIIGMGGVLDTARLHALGHSGLVLGAHGELMAPKPALDEASQKALVGMGPALIAKKGGTVYGPAVSLTRMVYAIANNTRELLPCSCVLQGEYGLDGLSIGVPARLCMKGIEDIVVGDVPPIFNEAAASIKTQIAALGL